MSDPLGLIGGSGGIHPVGPHRQPGAGESAAQGGPSFKDLLRENINEVNRLQQDADAAAEDLMAGRSTNVENVLLATQKADMAFKMLLQVRNKVMAAYEEIKQTRV